MVRAFFLFFAIVFFGFQLYSQNVGVISKVSPNSGCQLTNNELVTVVIFNFGSSYSGSFDVSYQINGLPPITETITLSPFPATSTFSYTFTTLADLSIPNTYNFKFYTNLVGDVNNSNDTLNGIVVVSDAFSVGGTVNSSSSVCLLGNSGTLNLTSQVGTVQSWESSINSGASWNNIINTTTSQNYTNITQDTWYRAIVKNGLCPRDTSTNAILSIDSASIGGQISGSTTVCVPPNSGTLTLSGERGTVLDWEYSSNGGSLWNSLSNTSNIFNYLNQPSTYLYRVIVQNGICQIAYSDTAEVIVMNGAIGGVLSPSNQTVCSNVNTGLLSLSGQLGTISNWESSVNAGVLWSPIVNNTDSLVFTNLTQETWYRVIITTCNIDTSSIAKIMIDNIPVGGNLSFNDTVCVGSNTGTITLTGEIGSVIDWESSIDGGSTWATLSNISNTSNYNNLLTTTMFRAIVGNSSCSSVYSDTVTITVNSIASAGTISAATNVCVSGNSGNLISSGVVGNVYDWLFSTNGGVTWTSLGNTSSTQIFNNLTQTTEFQVMVENGVCPKDSISHIITVDATSAAGLLSVSDSVCIYSSGLVYLSGYSGSVMDWESSINNGLSWNSMSYTSDSLTYNNITNAIMYRSIVKSGTCLNDTSNTISLDIYPFNIGTSNDTTINQGENATISAFGGLFYNWTPTTGLTTPNNFSTIASPLSTTIYTVSIIDVNGCLYLENVVVYVTPETVESSGVIISDLITANNDGYNDTWNIMGIENYPDSKVMVFNTSGNLVYESSNYKNDWKGTWQGNQLPDGTYYYRVEIKGEDTVKKGFLTIVSQ